jgi:perosamine synthetase
MIPIYKPYLPKKSLSYAHEAIDSGWISSLGKYKILCEEKLKEKFGYKYVLLVNNGTSANYLIAKSLKYKYPNINRIIVPNSCYVAAYNVFLHDKDFELYCLDIDIDNWNIKINQPSENDAVLIVHNLGNIFNIPKLKREINNIIIEDNCEGIGGTHEGTFSGTQSLCSSLSFFANKNITCGEGGAFCTNDEELYIYSNLLHGQGQSEKRYIHNILGNNFRMTNIQAALLYGQLEIFDEVVERKEKLFNYYRKELSNLENIKIQQIEENCFHSNWMFGVRVIGNKSYENVEKYFNNEGIEIRPFFYPISFHNHLKNIEIETEINSKILSRECFMIPSYPELKKKEQKYIIETIKKYNEGILND